MFADFLRKGFEKEAQTPGINPNAPFPTGTVPQTAEPQQNNGFNPFEIELGGDPLDFVGNILLASKPGRAYDKMRRQDALERLAEDLAAGNINQKDATLKYAGITGDYSGVLPIGGSRGALAGGATGVLIDRLMRDNPGMTYTQALYEVQTGNRTQTRRNADGTITSAPGAGTALGTIAGQRKFGEKTGELTAEGRLAPGIAEETARRTAQAKADVEGSTAPDIAFDVKKAEADAKRDSEKEGNFNTVMQTTDQTLDILGKLIDDQGNLRPGVDSVLGGFLGLQGRQSSVLPLGEEQRKFQPILDQVRGKAFLQAFETLKGGGQITEIEGRNATQAIARLDQAQEPEDFAVAVGELRDVVKGIQNRIRGEKQERETGRKRYGGFDVAPQTGQDGVIDFNSLAD